MLANALDFIKFYIDLLNESLKDVGGSLTKAQKAWLAFCLTAMIFTNIPSIGRHGSAGVAVGTQIQLYQKC